MSALMSFYERLLSKKLIKIEDNIDVEKKFLRL